MDHRIALAIFEQIRERPYRVSTSPNIPANNCFFKGLELLQRLGSLGYAVRGRICETFWEGSIFPSEIVVLYPKDLECTHFFIEVEIEGTWRLVDASFPSAMRKVGAFVGEFRGTPRPCFPVRKLYTHEESIQVQTRWQDETYALSYFDRCQPFLISLNRWLESLDEC